MPFSISIIAAATTGLRVTACVRGRVDELRAAIELRFIEDDIDRGLYRGLQEGGGTGVREDRRMLVVYECVYVCMYTCVCVHVCVCVCTCVRACVCACKVAK